MRQCLLSQKVFAGAKVVSLTADQSDIAGFEAFLERYRRALPVERAAVETMEEA